MLVFNLHSIFVSTICKRRPQILAGHYDDSTWGSSRSITSKTNYHSFSPFVY